MTSCCWFTHREYQAAAGGQLFKQNRGTRSGAAAPRIRSKGLAGPALEPVSMTQAHVAYAQCAQLPAGALYQRLDTLDGTDLINQIRQNRGLVPRTTPQLQHFLGRPCANASWLILATM